MARTTDADHEVITEAIYDMVTGSMLFKNKLPMCDNNAGVRRGLFIESLARCSPVVLFYIYLLLDTTTVRWVG